MVIPRELSERECLQVLAEQKIGRLAVCTTQGPRVFPLNYVLDGSSLVFRTSPYGAIAREAEADTETAFEVDRVDGDTRTGCSVLVVGKLRVIEDPHDLLSLQDNPQPWAGGSRSLYLRLRWRLISGRGLTPAPGTR